MTRSKPLCRQSTLCDCSPVPPEGDRIIPGPVTQRGMHFYLGRRHGDYPDILDSLPDGQLLRIPMLPDNRSLNLSNATAIIIYEAWRQLGFAGAS